MPTIEWEYPLSYNNGDLEQYIPNLTTDNDVVSDHIIHLYGQIDEKEYDLFYDLKTGHFCFPPSEGLDEHIYMLGEELQTEIKKLKARKITDKEKWLEDIILNLKTLKYAQKSLKKSIDCADPIDFEKIEFVSIKNKKVQFHTKAQADELPSEHTITLQEFFLNHNKLFHKNSEKLMALETNRLNKALAAAGIENEVSIWQTDDYYEIDEDENDYSEEEISLYEDSPMYEAQIIDEDEEEVEDTTTGRYCNLLDVIGEIEETVKSMIEVENANSVVANEINSMINDMAKTKNEELNQG